MKTKLKIVVDKASYFLDWEIPYFRKEFDLVDEPSENAIVLAFGPDVLEFSAKLPALKRTAVLFPGFYYNPYHNLECRQKMLELVENHFDVIFVNPGPIEEALKLSNKIVSHPFSVDVDKILKFKKVRKSLTSLIHVSADSPQKDWERSKQIMELTGLKNEVYPPRSSIPKITWKDRIMWRYNKYVTQKFNPTKAFRTNIGYVSHRTVIRKYSEYDGFVHVAAEKQLLEHIDGKYTAALLEAGVTGSVIFWHDTLNLGNNFETVIHLPKDIDKAASEILHIRKNLDVERQSEKTSQEISDTCHPEKVVAFRRKTIERFI